MAEAKNELSLDELDVINRFTSEDSDTFQRKLASYRAVIKKKCADNTVYRWYSKPAVRELIDHQTNSILSKFKVYQHLEVLREEAMKPGNIKLKDALAILQTQLKEANSNHTEEKAYTSDALKETNKRIADSDINDKILAFSKHVESVEITKEG